LQHRRRIVDRGIDVDVRAQIFRKLFLLASTPDCDSMESHVPRKLDTKMPKPTDALHGKPDLRRASRRFEERCRS